jgi:hypothetical protein
VADNEPVGFLTITAMVKDKPAAAKVTVTTPDVDFKADEVGIYYAAGYDSRKEKLTFISITEPRLIL